MNGARSRLRRVVRAGGFAGITAGMLPPYLLRRALAGSKRDEVRDRWVRRWSQALLDLFAVHVDVYGRVTPGRGRLVVANHRSTIDIAILLSTFGGRMVSRADVAGWPIVGAAARAVGTVFVDRKSATSGANTNRSIRDTLRAGDTICLFPEGTTFEGDEVRPFHAGAFVAAARSGAEIVPVGIAYESGSEAAFVGESFMAHLSRMAGGEPTRAAACIGEPFTVEGARAPQLREHAHAEVQRLVHEARRLCDRRDRK